MELKKGLSVYFERSINGVDSHWLTIYKINGELITGIIDFSDIEITINEKEVLRAIGSLDWNIQNLDVLCSQNVIDNKNIGYFINRLDQLPGYFGRHFYSESERYLNKQNIDLITVSLKEIVEIDNSIKPLLEDFCYYGCIKEDGKFKILKDTDIVKLDRNIFPSSIEV